MNIIKCPSAEKINRAIQSDNKLKALISFDGKHALVGESGESSAVLFENAEFHANDYFTITFDQTTADWNFVCPRNYKSITDENQRIEAFYNDGLKIIPEFLIMFGYFSKIKIKNAPPEIWGF